MTDEAAARAAEPGRDGSSAGAAGEGQVERAIRRSQAGEDREGSFRVLYETFFHPLQRSFARKGFSSDESLPAEPPR